MSTIRTSNSPMHENCTIGQPYGNASASYICGFHTGVDFPQSGVATLNPYLYPVMDGVVVDVVKNVSGTSPALRKPSTNISIKRIIL